MVREMKRKKVIIDTDMADDIDDAFALVMAMQMPEIELVGVTTVFRDTKKRARVVKKLLSLWGIDVPVYAGISGTETTMKLPVDYTPNGYTRDLENGEYEPLNASACDGGQGAIDFLINSAKTYGEELTIVAIGPLMNIAEAIKRDPESMARVNRVLLMGGAFYEHFNEWNFKVDPEAGRTVLESGVNCTCVGIDVTWQTELSQEKVDMLKRADLHEGHHYLSFLIEEFLKQYKRLPVLHDPLTVYSLIHPEIITTEDIVVEVLTEGERMAGVTLNMDVFLKARRCRLEGKRTTVAKAVRAKEFIEEFMKLVLAPMRVMES